MKLVYINAKKIILIKINLALKFLNKFSFPGEYFFTDHLSKKNTHFKALNRSNVQFSYNSKKLFLAHTLLE